MRVKDAYTTTTISKKLLDYSEVACEGMHTIHGNMHTYVHTSCGINERNAAIFGSLYLLVKNCTVFPCHKTLYNLSTFHQELAIWLPRPLRQNERTQADQYEGVF